ncbi:unnamed protein product [Calypogeia fissa]
MSYLTPNSESRRVIQGTFVRRKLWMAARRSPHGSIEKLTNFRVEKTSKGIKTESNSPNEAEFQDKEQEEVPRPVFRLGPVITDWDEQRAQWLKENPGKNLNRKGKPKMILVTSSQPDPCPSSKGELFLVKALKNKLDYTRLHDIDLYYNMAIMDPAMTGFFIKHPMVRKLMLSHPEAEWIWWMDSDAFFTDMTFELPMEKYKDHNLVLQGWADAIYKDKNWIGLNAGIFLIRNCQWSLTMLDKWVAMGEDYDDHRQKMGTLTAQVLAGRPDFVIDDQSALVYLLVTTESDELRSKVYLENSYSLHGYWVWAMGRHDELMKEMPPRKEGEEYWPFITHFVGCKSCTGAYTSYDIDLCFAEMERAFNIADNQVLHIFGFEHEDLTSQEIKRTRRDWGGPLDHLDRVGELDFLQKHPWRPTVEPNIFQSNAKSVK